MNTINFSNSNKNFPLSTQALEFMKVIAQQAYQLTALGGDGNYILSGCMNTSGNNWSAGWVVISGEMLPFTGGVGTLTGNVRIVETKEAVIAGYETYHDVYVRRNVEFGTNVGGTNTHVWNTFTRVKSNIELAAQSATKTELEELRLLIMPKGAMMDFDLVNNPMPTGWHLQDGSFVEGYGYVPNRCGRVAVGFDPKSANIPKNVTDLTENYGAVGNTGGKPAVTLTTAQLPAHSFKTVIVGNNNEPPLRNDSEASIVEYRNDRSDGNSDYVLDGKVGTPTHGKTNTVGEDKAHENRMPYCVVYPIIKVV